MDSALRWRRLVWAAGKLALGAALLALVLWRGGATLAAAIRNPVRVGPLLLALLFGVAGPLCGFLRWHLLARAQGLGVTLAESWRLGCLGYFWGTVLPGSVGGDVVKAGILAQAPERRAGAIASIVVDRVVGLFGLFFLAATIGLLAGGLEAPALRTLTLSAAVLTGGGLAAALLAGLLPAQVGSSLERLPFVGAMWGAVWMYRSRLGVLAAAALLAVVGHAGFILNFHFAAWMFQTQEADLPTAAHHFLIVPAGQLFGSVFPTPGGLGGAEFGFGQLYALLGKPEAHGVLASLAVRAITWVLCLVGLLAWLGGKLASQGREPTTPVVVSIPLEQRRRAG